MDRLLHWFKILIAVLFLASSYSAMSKKQFLSVEKDVVELAPPRNEKLSNDMINLHTLKTDIRSLTLSGNGEKDFRDAGIKAKNPLISWSKRKYVRIAHSMEKHMKATISFNSSTKRYTNHISIRSVHGFEQKPAFQGSNLNSQLNYSYFTDNPCSFVANCSINIGKLYPICYCDAYCHAFRDCCIDIYGVSNLQGIDEPKLQKIRSTKCDRRAKLRNPERAKGYHFISDCPSNFSNLDIERKCLSLGEVDQPVTSADGISYKNEYCAFCQNERHYYHWNVLIFLETCLGLDILAMKEKTVEKRLEVMKQQCVWVFIPDDRTEPRVCVKVESVPRKTCPDFMNPLKTYDKMYRNVWCMPSLPENNLRFTCIEPTKYSARLIGLNVQSMTVLFRFHKPSSIENKPVCTNDETFKPELGICIEDGCDGPENDNLDNRCDKEVHRKYELKLLMTLSSETIIYPLQVLQAITALYTTLPSKYRLTVVKILGKNFCKLSVECCLLDLMVNFKVQKELSFSKLELFSLHMKNLHWTYHEISMDSNFTIQRNGKETSDLNNTVCSKDTGNIEPVKYKFEEKDFLKTLEFIEFNHTNTDDIPASVEIFSYVEFSSKSNSSKKLIIHDVKRKNRTINLDNHNLLHAIVSSTAAAYTQGIITYVSMSTSCISLTTTLIIYKQIGLSLTVPGTISNHMMVNLLFSQVLFMAGISATDNKILCLIIGILSHYLWLTTFVWVCIFMIHITNVLARLRSNPTCSYSEVHHFSIHNYFIGYGGAFIIVIPSVILELSRVSNIDIGYTSDVCFPTGYPGNLIFFMGPIMLCLLFNCLMLIIAIVCMSKYTNSIQYSSIRVNRHYIITYIKLTFLSSCSWLIGLLGEVLNSDVMKYIFVILSGSHGFIISICFLSTRQVLTFLRDKCQKRQVVDTSIPLHRVSG